MPDPTAAARLLFWRRTLRVTVGLLTVWLVVNLAVPWFARDLDKIHGFGFPAGYWLAAVGMLWLYVLIITVYAVAMDRLEAQCMDSAEPDSTAPGPPQ